MNMNTTDAKRPSPHNRCYGTVTARVCHVTFTQGEFLGTSAMFWEKGARGKSTHELQTNIRKPIEYLSNLLIMPAVVE